MYSHSTSWWSLSCRHRGEEQGPSIREGVQARSEGCLVCLWSARAGLPDPSRRGRERLIFWSFVFGMHSRWTFYIYSRVVPASVRLGVFEFDYTIAYALWVMRYDLILFLIWVRSSVLAFTCYNNLWAADTWSQVSFHLPQSHDDIVVLSTPSRSIRVKNVSERRCVVWLASHLHNILASIHLTMNELLVYKQFVLLLSDRSQSILHEQRDYLGKYHDICRI